MNPAIWGPYLWRSIHFIALGYPSNPTPRERESYSAFFKSLGNVLPCFKCSLNYEKHLKELPIEPFLANGDLLFRWTVQLHNIVNRETGKPEMHYEDAHAMYKNGLSLFEEFAQPVVPATETKKETMQGLTPCEKYSLMFAVLVNILIISLIIFLLLK